MNGEKVIPITRAASLRGRVLSREGAAEYFRELTRVDVGKRTFIAEVGQQRGAQVWRIRVLGEEEVADFFDVAVHRQAFAALVSQDVATINAWFERYPPIPEAEA